MEFAELHGVSGVPRIAESTLEYAEYRGVAWSSVEYAEYAEYS